MVDAGASAFKMKTSTPEANFWPLLGAGLQVATGSKQKINLEEEKKSGIKCRKIN